MRGGIHVLYQEDKKILQKITIEEQNGKEQIKYESICMPHYAAWWVEHAEDIVDMDDQGNPILIKDCVRLSKKSDLHPSFRRQMSTQLQKRMEEFSKEDLSNVQILLTANWWRETENIGGWSYHGIELFFEGSGGTVYMILKWHSLDKKREYIGMEESVRSSDIVFDFCFDSDPVKVLHPERDNEEKLRYLIQKAKEFEAETLRLAVRAPIEKNTNIIPLLRFPYKLCCTEWPDVFLKFILKNQRLIK